MIYAIPVPDKVTDGMEIPEPPEIGDTAALIVPDNACPLAVITPDVLALFDTNTARAANPMIAVTMVTMAVIALFMIACPWLSERASGRSGRAYINNGGRG